MHITKVEQNLSIPDQIRKIEKDNHKMFLAILVTTVAVMIIMAAILLTTVAVVRDHPLQLKIMVPTLITCMCTIWFLLILGLGIEAYHNRQKKNLEALPLKRISS